eukprot:NODE_148_length_15570_cov_0.950100.p4 type:complete len:579 gc:universal NODE_148_length_15570_cov_0.950100:5898-7634(+)
MFLSLVSIFGAYNPVYTNQDNLGHNYYCATLNQATLKADCQAMCDKDQICYAFTISTSNSCCLKFFFDTSEIKTVAGSSFYTKTDTTGMSQFFWATGFLAQTGILEHYTNPLQGTALNTSLFLSTTSYEKLYFYDTGKFTYYTLLSQNTIVDFSSNLAASSYIKTANSYLFFESPSMTGKFYSTSTLTTLRNCIDSCMNVNCKFLAYTMASSPQCDIYVEGTTKNIKSIYGFYVFGYNKTRLLKSPNLDSKYTGISYMSQKTTYDGCYDLCYSDYSCKSCSFDGVNQICSLFSTLSPLSDSGSFVSWEIVGRPTKSTLLSSTMFSSTAYRSMILTTSSQKQLSTTLFATNLTSDISSSLSTDASSKIASVSSEFDQVTSEIITSASLTLYDQISTTYAIMESLDSDIADSGNYTTMRNSKISGDNIFSTEEVIATQISGNEASSNTTSFTLYGIMGAIVGIILVISAIKGCMMFQGRIKKRYMTRIQSRDIRYAEERKLGSKLGFDASDYSLNSIKNSGDSLEHDQRLNSSNSFEGIRGNAKPDLSSDSLNMPVGGNYRPSGLRNQISPEKKPMARRF